MATSSWPKYTVIIGATLTLGAGATTFALRVLDRPSTGIPSLLISEAPIAIPVAVVGTVVALIGTVGWAFRLSSQTLAVVGMILISLAVLIYSGLGQMDFGFDDPTMVVALEMVFAPGLVGVVCLLFAAARR
jgi:hypothetical protein